MIQSIFGVKVLAGIITGYFYSYFIDFGGGALTNSGCFCEECPCPDLFLAKFDSKGNPLFSKSFGGSSEDRDYSITIDSSNNVYITGVFNSYNIDFGGGYLHNYGERDIFLTKFDSNGNHIWSKSFGGTGADVAYSISIDNKIILIYLAPSNNIRELSTKNTITSPSTISTCS